MKHTTVSVPRNPCRRDRSETVHIPWQEQALIEAIAERAFNFISEIEHLVIAPPIHADGYALGASVDYVEDIVTATHLNGRRLRLSDLLHADLFDFIHDIEGIDRHLDKNTGKLTMCFLPRFSE